MHKFWNFFLLNISFGLLINLLKLTNKELIDKLTYDEKQTALHYAAKQGNTEIVKLLLDNGANKEAEDFINRTPIYLACEYGISFHLNHKN